MITKLKCGQSQSTTQRKGEKGFTLTELLIVIVATGILPAITMPFVLDHYDVYAFNLGFVAKTGEATKTPESSPSLGSHA